MSEHVLYAATLASLDELPGLPALRALRVIASDVADLSALARCPALEEIELVASIVGELPAIPTLRRLTAYGCCDVPAELPGVLVRTDNDEARTINHALRARGLPLRYTNHVLGIQLVRPGLGADRTFVSTWPTRIEEALAAPDCPTDPDAFLARVGFDVEQPHREVSRFLCESTIGDAADARAWLAASPLPPPEQAALARFVDRFADARFVRETAAGLARAIESQHGELPRQLLAQRAGAFAGIGKPYRMMRVRLEDDPRWYRIGLLGWTSASERKQLGDELGIYPIGDEDGGRLRLGVPLLGDRRVYQYAYDAPPSPRYDSIADLYAAIVEHDPTY